MASSPESNNNYKTHVNKDNTGVTNLNGSQEIITNSEQTSSPFKTSESNSPQNVSTFARKRISPNAQVEKGQQEVESAVKEQALVTQSDDSDVDADTYNFTEDQKRAMMELMTQSEEDADLLDEEPPEYNVKGRLIQLNEELANDPTPVEAEREHKVGFKPKIVDLAASPPPDFTDDELQSSPGKQETNNPVITSSTEQKNNASGKIVNGSKENATDANKKQFVVEQDGQFYVVSANDLKSSEQRIFVDREDESKKKDEKQISNQKTKTKFKSYSSHGDLDKVSVSRSAQPSSTRPSSEPRPPLEPRPKSVAPNSRRSLHQTHSPQPRSAGQLNDSGSCLDNFTYSSPYAMTSQQKVVAREEARRIENDRREEANRKKLEEEEKRRYNENAFQVWLERKKEEGKLRQNENEENSGKKVDNEEAFKTWLKEKRTQVKQEKLLKRRQQQEQRQWFILRPRDDCEKAFKEWLKKKNADARKQQKMERQRNKLYRIQMKHSRKTLALIKALRETQAFRYESYYGYRF